MLLLLLGIPFLEFQGFAGFPLSAEKFPRWNFWVGHPGWQFFPFLCVGNQVLGGVSWGWHPGSLALFWWTFSDRWNYLSRNCWRLSSSPRVTWTGPSGDRDVSKQLLGIPKMWSAVRWHRGYMYQRIHGCYVFFIAIYNNHKWALVARYWWYKKNVEKLMCNPMCNSMWKGIHTEPSHFRVFEFLGKLRKSSCWKTTQNPWWKTMEKHWWKTMETPCQRHGEKVEHHATLFWAETHGHTLVENHGTLWLGNPWKTFGGKQRKSICGQQRKTAVGKLQTKWWKTWKTSDNIWLKATEKQYPLTFD